ncbi:HEAT repeat domain-containing protein [Cryptosporangium japonicum]|uniref:HEAT repeat domain-containing protein n=1 Tax=Cryptosporangium japonicum TaxID=80872 RepID=A0ABP3DBG6_9ACTN
MSHQHHIFHNPPPATPDDVLSALDRADIPAATNAMVGCALYGDGDWREAQSLFLALLDHDDPQVQSLAATCLGHLARVYRQLDEDRVVPALRRARQKPHVRGTATDALGDITTYLHPRRARWRGRLWRLGHPSTWW